MSTLPEKNIPRRLIAAATIFLFHSGCYFLSSQIIGWLGLPFYPVALPIDAHIPLIPLFAIPYVSWFVYLFFGYFLLARKRPRVQRFATASVLGALVSLAVFLLFPTHIDRPAVPGGGLINLTLKIIYAFDANACNLFPSMHVFMAWLFFIEMRRRRPARSWLTIGTLGYALLICAAVLFTRQHYIIDIPAGILLAESCWALSRWKRLQRFTDWFWNWVYKKKAAPET